MKSFRKVEQIVGQARVRADRTTDERILGDARAALAHIQDHRPQARRPGLASWRIVMNSKIARYSVAATVLVAAAIVLFGPFGGQRSIVLADVAHKLNATRTIIHKEKRLAWWPGEDKPFFQGQVTKYLSTDIGFMEEMYDQEGHLEHRLYLLKEGRIVVLYPQSKRYVELPAQGRIYEELLKMSSPGGMVDYFTATPYTKLGRSSVAGVEAEGFGSDSIDFSWLMDYLRFLFPIETLSARLWVDAQTSMPVEIEMKMDVGRGLMNGFNKLHAEFTAYDFQWDVPLPEGILTPNIPADYTQMSLGASAISAASAPEDSTPTTATTLWPADEGGNGHAYQGVSVGTLISWTAARQAATDAGGYLATITSAQEDAFVSGILDRDGAALFVPAEDKYYGPWLGGYQLPGSAEPGDGWVWVTGEPFEYTAWCVGEPSQTPWPLNEDRLHCMGRTGPASTWNDQPDILYFGPMSYMVEYDPVTFEAERAAVVPDGRIEAAFAGYSGEGYVLLTSRADVIRWTIPPGMAQEKGILLHYSNGTPQDVHVEVAVNGIVVEPNLACAPTGAWDAWGSAVAGASFTAGTNVIEIRNLADDVGPAIDRIAVFGDNTNLAVDRPIVFSMEWPGHFASQAVDGDLRSFWRMRVPGQWLEVDLGDVYPLYRTQLASPQREVCRFKVEVKAQAEDAYVEVVDRTDNAVPATATEPIVDTFEPIAARYVRLTVTGADWRSPEVAEFRISAVVKQTHQ
jgi:hypothetical protein